MIEFPKHYRIEREEGSAKGDPYGEIIPGRYGHVYRHSPDEFGVATNGPRLVPTLKKIARLVQDGTDGANLVFGADKLAAVARLIGARRRRQLTPEQRATLAEHGAKWRFPARISDAAAELTGNTLAT